MDQVYNSMIAMMQSAGVQPEKAAPRSGEQKETSFRDLLAKQQVSEETPPTEPVAELSPEVTAEVPADGESDLEQQMLAAAVAVLQRPVIPAEQPDTPCAAAPVSEQLIPVSQTVTPEPGTATDDPMPQIQQTPQSVGEADVPQTADPAVQSGRIPMGEDRPAEVTDIREPGGMDGAEDGGETAVEPGTGQPLFRDVRDVMVKVGETVKTDGGEPLSVPIKDQVGEQIVKALDQGETRLTVQLNPQNLGRVEVELTLTEQGGLRLELRAENRLTQQLLEKETVGLQQVLTHSTQRDVQVQVTRQQESQQQDCEDGRQGGHHHNPQQERREERRNGNDFLHKLRLGLIPLDTEAS